MDPATPNKADDGIERIKQQLAAIWNLQFPVRDSTWSPSKRDPTSLPDKIHGLIQYLYYGKGHALGALDYAIKQFEKQAPLILSQWQFKPRAELGVVPSRHEPSEMKREFLHKRHSLSRDAIDQLMECLYHHLQEVAGRVKSGHDYIVPEVALSSIQGVGEHNDNQRSGRIFNTESSMKRSNYRQSTLSQCFRSKSSPVPQHASSDNFMDDDISEVLQDVCIPDAEPPTPALKVSMSKDSSGHSSSAGEMFETPPTTPPYNPDPLPIQQENGSTQIMDVAEGSIFRKPSIPFVTRKRPCPEPEKVVHPRKLSRETSTMSGTGSFTGATDNGKTAEVSDTQPPAYSRRPSTMTHNLPLEASCVSMCSTTPSGSFESSITAASSNTTSPNTSFSTVSTSTHSSSFDRPSDDTDSTIRASLLKTRLQSPERKQSVRQAGLSDFPCLEREQDLYKKTIDTQELENHQIQEGILERLASNSPFVTVPNGTPVPFRQIYEVLRMAIFCKMPLTTFQFYLVKPFDNYNDFWLSLRQTAKKLSLAVPERSSLVAWKSAAFNFEGVSLSGKLKFLDGQEGPLLELILNPLRMERSNRMTRKCGSDRFCALDIPGLDQKDLPGYLSSHAAAARQAIISWLFHTPHNFLGRQWRALSMIPEKKKLGGRASSSLRESKHRIDLFAEDGPDFRRGPQIGEADPRIPDRPKTSVEQLIEWFMPARNNQDQPCLKFFARLRQGLSSTIPTVQFGPEEIIRSDDSRSDIPTKRHLHIGLSDDKKTGRKFSASHANVMNDGCARISREAALAAANMLGMDEPPSIFQGRIAGAKGVWMVDCLDEMPSHLSGLQSRRFWIEITDSQLKFNSHNGDTLYPDPARTTFEVNDWSKKLSPSFLNFQLLPILVNRGVPELVFVRLLEEDLTAKASDMEVAMGNGLTLRKWNQENNSVARERAVFGGIELQGGIPVSRAEKINWFVEHGFEPKHCYFLKEEVYKALLAYCIRLENRMNIGLGQSTNAFMIADPLAVLEENEVHLGFSSPFRDPKSGFSETMLHDIDLLVARSPAHLPSDIQKVRAVFKPALRIYRDVIVFSSKGRTSLASKLSGGDYDGDKAWICWDQRIVKPFENAEVPYHPPFHTYGIRKDETKVSDLLTRGNYIDAFLGHAFDFNLQPKLLGKCTIYHEAYCYARKAIDSPQAIEIAVLLGLLVDSAKNGFYFDDAKWTAYLKKNRLPKKMPLPAYKNKDKAKPTEHLIDVLVFSIAKQVRHRTLGTFAEHFADVPWWDEDLVRIRNEEEEESKSNDALAQVLRNLQAGLKKIHSFWKQHARREDDEDDFRPHTANKKSSDALSFKAMVEQCRADFIALAPTTADTEITPDSRIRRWQNEHRKGKAGYWDLVKASVAFHMYFKSRFVWYLAGIELGEIKATAKGRGTYRAVVNDVFESFKADGKLVDGIMKRRETELELGLEQRAGAGFMPDDNDDQEDNNDDDEFGEWGWEDEIHG